MAAATALLPAALMAATAAAWLPAALMATATATAAFLAAASTLLATAALMLTALAAGRGLENGWRSNKDGSSEKLEAFHRKFPCNG
jgi:hypothetical protein